MDQDVTWYGARPRPRRLTQSCLGRGRMGTPLPSTKGGLPKFSAHFYCSQNAGCIKMPLGMDVGLSLEDFVLDGYPAPLPKRGAEPPIFGPYLLRPNGCMDQDATWYGGRPRPTRYCVPCGRSYPQKKGTSTPPNFWPMSIVAKRPDE